MKKVVLPLLVLTALSSASAAERVGFFLLGAQYERDTNATDAFRVGVGLPIAGFFGGSGALALSGDVAWMRHTRALNLDGTGVQPYYGAGLGLSTIFAKTDSGSAAGLTLYPHALGGVNVGLNDRWALFAEGSVGPTIYALGASTATTSGSTSGVTAGLGVRLGATYRIR